MKKQRNVSQQNTSPQVIVPEDGLHQAMDQLKAKLGPTAFLDKLLKVAPPSQASTPSNPTQDSEEN